MNDQIKSMVSDRCRLRTALREARNAQGLSQQQVAQALDLPVNKIIRIENGSAEISVVETKALLLHYGIIDRKRVEEIVQLCRASKKAAWWESYREYLNQETLDFWAIESSAIRIKQFQSLVVPGLLQHPDYSFAVLAVNRDSQAAQRLVELRLKRQQLITDDGPEMSFILDESVLYRVMGNVEVLRNQLLKVKNLASHPNISIQIMPFTSGLNKGMQGPFEILEISEEPGDYAVIVEGPFKDTLVTDPPGVAKEYMNIFLELTSLALPAADTPDIINERLRDLR